MAPTNKITKNSSRKTKGGRTLVSTAIKKKLNGQLIRRPRQFRRNKLFPYGKPPGISLCHHGNDFPSAKAMKAILKRAEDSEKASPPEKSAHEIPETYTSQEMEGEPSSHSYQNSD
jgi:hypothetical protein